MAAGGCGSPRTSGTSPRTTAKASVRRSRKLYARRSAIRMRTSSNPVATRRASSRRFSAPSTAGRRLRPDRGRRLFQDPENTRNTSTTAREPARTPRRSARKWRQDPWRTVNPPVPRRRISAARTSQVAAFVAPHHARLLPRRHALRPRRPPHQAHRHSLECCRGVSGPRFIAVRITLPPNSSAPQL